MDGTVRDLALDCDWRVCPRVVGDDTGLPDKPPVVAFIASLSDLLVLGLIVDSDVLLIADVEFDCVNVSDLHGGGYADIVLVGLVDQTEELKWRVQDDLECQNEQ